MAFALAFIGIIVVATGISFMPGPPPPQTPPAQNAPAMAAPPAADAGQK